MIRGAHLFISNVKDPSLDQLISKMRSTDPNRESRSLPCKVLRGQITASLAKLFFYTCCSFNEKKGTGTDEGWPPTARAIDIPPETLPWNRSCNGIAVSANSVAMGRKAKRSHVYLLEDWALAT